MARYLDAVAWIALNDEDVLRGDEDLEEIADQLTVELVADIWNRAPVLVAKDVLAYRQRRDA